MSKAKDDLNALIMEYQKIYQHLDSVYRSLNDDASIADLPCRKTFKVSDFCSGMFGNIKNRVGAVGIDAVRNYVTRNQLRRAVLELYEVSAALQKRIIGKLKQLSLEYSMEQALQSNLVSQQQQQVNQELLKTVEQLSHRERTYQEKLHTLQARYDELSDLLCRINTLRTQVSK